MTINLDDRLNNGREYERGEVVAIDPCRMHVRVVNAADTFAKAELVARWCADCKATTA